MKALAIGTMVLIVAGLVALFAYVGAAASFIYHTDGPYSDEFERGINPNE